MIIDILLYLVYLFLVVLTAPFRLFSNVTLDSGMGQALSSAKDYIASLQPIFPVNTLLIVLGIMVVIEIAIFGYKGIMWIIKKIPGIS